MIYTDHNIITKRHGHKNLMVIFNLIIEAKQTSYLLYFKCNIHHFS